MPLLPDEIAVFHGPINGVTRTRHEAGQEVGEAVIHELGHYFGRDDDEMPHMTVAAAVDLLTLPRQ
jgi:predicted Zn-dependent protease with MMP-like domain